MRRPELQQHRAAAEELHPGLAREGREGVGVGAEDLLHALGRSRQPQRPHGSRRGKRISKSFRSLADPAQGIDQVDPRLHRRELGLETNQDYEMAMLELLSGGRGYLTVDDRMREVLGASLKSPNPDPQLIREFASSRISLAPDAVRQVDPDALPASAATAPTAPAGIPVAEPEHRPWRPAATSPR
jgi:hypothetical protein